MRTSTKVVVVLSAAMALAACSSGAQETSSAATPSQEIDVTYAGPLDGLPSSYEGADAVSGDLRIGFLQPLGANELVGHLGEAIEKQVEKVGGTLVTFDAEGSPDAQVTQFQQLLDQDVDAIIVFPLDAGALDPSLAQAKAAGVPVIAVEASPEDTSDIGNFTTQIIEGRDLHAFTQAKAMAELHPGGQVAVVGFGVPVPSIEAYADRVTYWAGQFGLDVVTRANNASDDVAGGETVAAGLLTQYPDLVGVLAYNDPSAIGAATAARSAGRELTVMGLNGGSDAISAVTSGQEAFSIQFPIIDWAKQAVAAAYLAVQQPGVQLPPTVFPGIGEVLTSDTIGQARDFDTQIADEYGN